VDDPEHDRCEKHYVLATDDGRHVRLDLAVLPDVLEPGMRLMVHGEASRDRLSVDPVEISIEPDDTPARDPAADVSGTTRVLVVLLRFTDTAEPYSRDQVNTTVFAGAGSVANYYRETSYGRHTLAGDVTPWLVASFARPGTCDYSRISTEALRLAASAGYPSANYQKYVFVFPSVPSCGWAGLGGGQYAWINQNASTLVIGHELGHTFGLGHASSLRCTNAGVPSVIDGTCSRSEYGDAFSIMGNGRAAHLSAPHKVELGYVGTGAYRIHAGGSATYKLSPYEAPGGSIYAIKIPAAPTRQFWLEFRRPAGFDATLPAGATNGALVHLSYPSDWSCDSCLLDMTPATSGTSDAALAVGQTFRDSVSGTVVTMRSEDAAGLTVDVSMPGRTTYSDVPATHMAYAAIETLAWHGIAVECGVQPLRYCPDAWITRAEMAAFLERATRGPSYPFAATGTRFADVPLSNWAARYIEQLHADGITNGCNVNPLRYCPAEAVTRGQMAPLLLKARYGATFDPGVATGTPFGDVPRTHQFAAWIEKLYSYRVTLGCSATALLYCPESSVTRGQMALFIQRAFALAPPPG
jgi:hypothetical protein